jgi:hypothetical protein
MKTAIVSIILITLLSGIGLAVQPGRLPYGIQNLNNVSDDRLKELRDSLGFNLAYMCDYDANVLRERITDVDSLGYDVIPYMMSNDYPGITSAFQTYLHGHYIVTQAEDSISQIGFLTRNGYVDSQNPEWYVAPKSEEPYVFLDNLWYEHEGKYMWPDSFVYTPSLYMRIFPDTSIHSPGDTVAWLNIWDSYPDWWTRSYYESVWGDSVRHGGVVYTKPILASMFNGSNPDTIDLSTFMIPQFWIDTISNMPTILDTIYNPPPPYSTHPYPSNVLTYQIVSAGRPCSLAVSWLKVDNDYGRQIIDGVYDRTFRDYAQQSDSTFLWQLRDDMRTDQMMLARHLEDIIEGNSDKQGMMKFCEIFIVSPKDFVKVTGAKNFWIDRYVLFGGSQFNTCSPGGSLTLYYGDQYDYQNGIYGLQALVNQYFCEMLDSIKVAIGDSVKLYMIPQMQTQRFPECPYYIHRRATNSELRMQISMGLCYKVDGIQYWPYESGQYGWNGEWYDGLVEHSSQSIYVDIWNQIKNYATPEIQALDEYLVDSNMVWERAYNSYQIESRGNFVSDIHCWSDSYNPDVGWAQIGEFHNDTSGAKYIMLVNRACNIDSITEAPPQHFTLRFNPNALNLGAYLLITDLADTVHYDAGTHEWVGDPHTTYSATMPDGTIPYTITLRAGEGKLIKIATANN